MSESVMPRERGKLQSAEWADFDGRNLDVSGAKREIQMANSDGTGTPLLKNKNFGADVIRFGAGEGVAEHTHIGQHVLFVLRGAGIVKYDGVDNDLYPGKCYMVESWVPHAIYAGEEDSLVLLVVGDDHRGLDDPGRMELTDAGKEEVYAGGPGSRASEPSLTSQDVLAFAETAPIRTPDAYLN